jgi:hypothetical protein
MTIDEAKRYIEGQARQNQVGNISISQLNIYFKRAQLEVVDELRAVYEQTSMISDALAPLVKTSTITTVSSGQIDKPDDYRFIIPPIKAYYSSGSYTTWAPAPIATSSEESYRLNSQINYPTGLDPMVVSYDTYFQIYPESITQVKLTYVRNPLDPAWNYTLVNSAPVYSSGASINFELPDSTHMRICQKVLGYYGISLRDPELVASTTNNLNK